MDQEEVIETGVKLRITTEDRWTFHVLTVNEVSHYGLIGKCQLDEIGTEY
jgi:hypothetical protein